MKWIRRSSDFINKWKKDRRVRLGITLAAVIISALIQTYALQVFVRPAGIISGGFTGIAMLVERLGGLWGVDIPMQITMVALNIPVALMCCKGISIRFTVFSLVQVFLSSIFLQVFNFTPIFTDEVLNVIFGGVIFGCAIVIALRGNASSGGTDFIALFVSNRAVHLELCILWQCGDVLLLRRHIWLEACRIFHHLPVHFHQDDIRVPPQI